MNKKKNQNENKKTKNKTKNKKRKQKQMKKKSNPTRISENAAFPDPNDDDHVVVVAVIEAD